MVENRGVDELQKELAHLKKELERYQQPDAIGNDLYYSATYWRDRCLKAENQLDILKLINEDIGDRQSAK